MSKPATTNRVLLRIIDEYALDVNDPLVEEKAKEKLEEEFDQWLEDHEEESEMWGKMAEESEKSEN